MDFNIGSNRLQPEDVPNAPQNFSSVPHRKTPQTSYFRTTLSLAFEKFPSMLTMRHRIFRAAIAMNNLGCSMLDRGCYAQAHQTLTDAAQVMVKLTSTNEDDDHNESSTRHRHDADCVAQQLELLSKLHAANQRHAASMLISLSPRKLSCLKPLRLEPEIFDANETADLYLMSAIAVHNMALSCLCQSMDTDQAKERREKLQTKAITLLQSSYRLIREGDHGTWAATTIQVAIHILESLTQAIATSDIPEDSGHRKLFTELAGLRSAVRTMSRSAHVHLLPGTSGLAPAA